MKNVVAVVLGGGRGTRLLPLTEYRSKPAVPLAGKYRLIDIPISNCLNSGINQIYVLTQFQSVSLHRHIRGTYRFDNFSGGFVEILAAQQTMDSRRAARLVSGHGRRRAQEPALPRAAGHRVRADPLGRPALPHGLPRHARHARGGQGATSRSPPSRSTAREAGALGIMRVDDTGRVVGFLEKPQDRRGARTTWRMDPQWIDARGIDSRGRDCLASMGIYLFNRDTLLTALEKTNYRDFGKEVFPGLDALAARAGARVRRLLGRHRHDPLVLRCEPAACAAESAVRSGVGHGADLHAAALPAADADRRRDDHAAA